MEKGKDAAARDTDALTEDESSLFGRRLDAFALKLSLREQNTLSAISRAAELAQNDDIDHRTPGDIIVSMCRSYRSPRISLNPQPVPSTGPLPVDTQGDRR